MKINRITLWQVPLTSHCAYYMADGKTCDTVTTAVLRLDTDEGLSGWGEVCPIPHYALPADLCRRGGSGRPRNGAGGSGGRSDRPGGGDEQA
jgi:hypothetical protein